MICFVLAVIIRLAFFSVTQFTADDAYITFRYAQNIAFGDGMVYNQGQQVLGTTTPLFTLLLSFFALVGMPLVKGALLISSLASGMTAALLYRFAHWLRFRQWTFVPALLYILWPRSIVADASGMETALFSFLVLTAFYFQFRKLPLYAIAAATLATVTRPEGLGLLVLLLVVELVRYPRQWGALVITPLIILVPWIGFSTLYFGTPVPHAIPAKLALYSTIKLPGLLERLQFLLAWHHPAGWIVTVAAVVGLVWLYRRQYWGRLVAVWLVALVMFYAVSPTHLFFWYAAPLAPLLLLLASAVLPFISERTGDLGSRSVWLRFAVGAVLTVGLVLGNIGPWSYYNEYQHLLENTHQAIGEFLGVRARSGDIVAAEDIGYIGFYSGATILDRDGLVSPQAVPYNRRGDYLQLVLDAEPQWVVAASNSPISRFVDDSAFLARYRLYPDSANGVYSYSRSDIVEAVPYYLYHRTGSATSEKDSDSLDNQSAAP